MGIYCGGEPHWFVNKNLAQAMSMEVKYRGKTIIRYSQTTWWITGFNPNYKYLDATAAELFVKYTIRFKDTSLYHNFKRDWGKKWRCDDKLFSASYSF